VFWAPHPSLLNSPFTEDDKVFYVLKGHWMDVVLGVFCTINEALELPALIFAAASGSAFSQVWLRLLLFSNCVINLIL
jgi:hypothetical protein